MTADREFPDPAAGPVDVSRVCAASDAPWDARNDQLADAIRSSVERPNEAAARVRRLIEQGLHINARTGQDRTALELAAYYDAPAGITAMLAYASREGRAAPSAPDAPPVAVPPEAAHAIAVEFRGSAREYFRIWAVNLCLTLLTLGIFSAWAKVRKKRYFYSHTTLDGTPFQYLGQPLPILKGRIVAVVLFLAWYLSSHFFVELIPAVIVVATVLAPWVIVRSAAFNARYSAFRNMTFNFDARYRDSLLTVYAWGLIPLILVGGFILWRWEQAQWLGAGVAVFALVLPFWLAAMKRFLVGHTRFGGIAGQLSITGGNYYYIYFKAGLIVAGLSILAGLVVAAAAALGKGRLAGEYMFVFALLPFYLVYLFAYAYGQAQTANLVWNNTRLGPLGFQSVLTGRGLAWLYASNGFAILLSLGLLIPWAVVRSFRYRAERLRGVLQGEWDVYQGSEASAVQAAGAEVGEMFDLDFSL
jgi:uncharacterized membrane protein YjgN (DUF898 family)